MVLSAKYGNAKPIADIVMDVTRGSLHKEQESELILVNSMLKHSASDE